MVLLDERLIVPVEKAAVEVPAAQPFGFALGRLFRLKESWACSVWWYRQS